MTIASEGTLGRVWGVMGEKVGRWVHGRSCTEQYGLEGTRDKEKLTSMALYWEFGGTLPVSSCPARQIYFKL